MAAGISLIVKQYLIQKYSVTCKIASKSFKSSISIKSDTMHKIYVLMSAFCECRFCTELIKGYIKIFER